MIARGLLALALAAGLWAAPKAAGAGGPCGGDGRRTLASARVEQGLGTVEDAALAGYLNGVLARLVSVSDHPDCRVVVYVTPHDATEAAAFGDGGILLTFGFLRNLKNEDEVAALLGHELSHVLRNHHASDSFVDSQDDLLKGLDAANAAGKQMASFIDPKLSQRLDDASVIGQAAYDVSEGLIAPAWTRDQEDEADLLGTDLAVAAGYNAGAMAAVMDVLKANEARLVKIDAERERLWKERLAATGQEAARETNVKDVWSIVRSVAKIASQAAQGISSKKRHHPAGERKKAITAHVRKHHKKARRRKFQVKPWIEVSQRGRTGKTFERYRDAAEARRLLYTGGDSKKALDLARRGTEGRHGEHPYPRLALSEARLKRGQRRDAERQLSLAMERRGAPWQIFRAYAELKLNAGRPRDAARAVEDADEVLGRPLAIAPYAISVHRRAGNRDRVRAYLDRCEKAGSRAQLKACRAATGRARHR